MSPSTLTRTIKLMESQLGVTLFDRDNRRVSLTNEGRLLQGYARDVLARWSDLQNELLQETGSLQGNLTLYGSVTASYSFLFDQLARLRERYPKIRINLQTGDAEQALSRVVAGDVEMSLGAKPPTLPAIVDFKTVAKTPLVLVIAKTHPDASRLRHADHWADVPLILPERGVARDRVIRWFRERGVTPPIAAQVAGNEAIVSMVSLGEGVGVVPQIVLDNSPLAGQVKVLPIKALQDLEVGWFVLRRSLKNRLVAAVWHMEL